MRSDLPNSTFLWVVWGSAALIALPAAGQQRPALQFDLSFSRDGTWLATCGDRVRVYETGTGRRVRELEGKLTRCVAFSPAAADLLAAGGDDGVLRLWTVGAEDGVREFRGHDGMIVSVAFAGGGRYLASCSTRLRQGKQDLGQFRLWNLETGAAEQSLNVEGSGVQGVSFSSDGGLVALCRNGAAQACQVDLYRVQPWAAVASLKLSAGQALETTAFGQAAPLGMASAFMPGSQRLLVAGGICVRVDAAPYRVGCQPTGLIWAVDLADKPTATPLIQPSRGYFRALGITPDGKRFATGNGQRTPDTRPQIQLRDVADGKLVWSVPTEVEPFGVAVSPDGRLVAACEAATVRLLNSETGETVRVLTAAD